MGRECLSDRNECHLCKKFWMGESLSRNRLPPHGFDGGVGVKIPCVNRLSYHFHFVCICMRLCDNNGCHGLPCPSYLLVDQSGHLPNLLAVVTLPGVSRYRCLACLSLCSCRFLPRLPSPNQFSLSCPALIRPLVHD